MSDSLAPQTLRELFRKLSAAPRESGRMLAIQQFMKAWCSENGVLCTQDKVGNLILRSKWASGLRIIVILQAHMDMVGAVKKGFTHDFATQPIHPIDDTVHAGFICAEEETSLGADDGAGMAMAMLALTDPDLRGFPIEVIMTVDEETTMLGAKGLDSRLVQAPYLINLDSETGYEITCGSAGGETSYINIKDPATHITPDTIGFATTITVSGAAGGHSGLQIHLGGANAISVMARVLYAAVRSPNGRLVSMHGGSAHNAIPTECTATVSFVDQSKAETAVKDFGELSQKIIAEYRSTDPDMKIEVTAATPQTLWAMDPPSSGEFISGLMLIPTGVVRMSPDIQNLTETSCNLAVVAFDARSPAPDPGKKEAANIVVSYRSTHESQLDSLFYKLEALAQVVGVFQFEGARGSRYPAWPPKYSGTLLAIMTDAYHEAVGRKLDPPAHVLVHAGMEVGELLQKQPKMEAVAIGPTIIGAHTYDERLEISSWQLSYEALKIAIIQLTGRTKAEGRVGA